MVVYDLNRCNILLDTKTRDLMKSIARKDQTYDSFIIELLNMKIKSDASQVPSSVGVDIERSNPALRDQSQGRKASPVMESGGDGRS